MKGRVGPRVALTGATVMLVAGAVGLIVSLLMNVFVFDEFDAYGEIPIPGSERIHLPAGEVTINFHTFSTGSSSGGFPVPPLKIRIVPPEGAPDPVLTETMGSTTSVNNDVRLQVWIAQIAEEGLYEIETGGEVDGYISPRLAFGRDTSPGWMPWVFGGLLAAGIVSLVASIPWWTRSGRRPQPLPAPVSLDEPTMHTYQPTDEGVRLEQLKTLAALRDSGALTVDEFESEKRRILDGQ